MVRRQDRDYEYIQVTWGIKIAKFLVEKELFPSNQSDQSFLLFFHKIHCGTMSIGKDKYLTPSQGTRSNRSSDNSQYCRPQSYSDALKYSFLE